MSEADPALPSWVIKRDGRQEPFSADKISHALFSASDDLEQPDAFLARELTDGIVHFVTLEADDGSISSQQIEEIVIKIVRELGQPALARCFAEHARKRSRASAPAPVERLPEMVLRLPALSRAEEVWAACRRGYSLQTVFARDIVAAHESGLLTLTGLEHPCELARCVLPARPAEKDASLGLQLVQARRHVAEVVAFDGPELELAGQVKPDVPAFLADLELGLRLSGLSAVLNLNAATPPPWADHLSGGPLFPNQQADPAAEGGHHISLALAEAVSAARVPVQIAWHLSASDFAPEQRPHLEKIASLTSQGSDIAFVFDRPRRAVALAEGLDRICSAALLTVGLNLFRLADQPGIGDDPGIFLTKLASLARLALTAGVQKRAFLRKRQRDEQADPAGLATGFWLDRARLVVCPVGLDAVVQRFVGRGIARGGRAVEFARQILTRLREVLRTDGQCALLDTSLDGPTTFSLTDDRPTLAAVAGITAWGGTASAQIRSAGALHSAADGGTAALVSPGLSVADVIDMIQLAWERGEMCRLVLRDE